MIFNHRNQSDVSLPRGQVSGALRRDVKEDVKSVLIGAVEKAPSQGYGIEILDKGDPEFRFRHSDVMISDYSRQTG